MDEAPVAPVPQNRPTEQRLDVELAKLWRWQNPLPPIAHLDERADPVRERKRDPVRNLRRGRVTSEAVHDDRLDGLRVLGRNVGRVEPRPVGRAGPGGEQPILDDPLAELDVRVVEHN